MTTEVKIKALLAAIERRLTDISEQQHALAVQKAYLLDSSAVAARVVAPDLALVQLKAKGVTLRGLTAAWSDARRPRPALLKAVASIRRGSPLAR